MKAFITGGTGFIGSHLVDFLSRREDVEEVRCLVRNKEKWLSGKHYTRVDGDLHNLAALKRGIDGSDVVFHIAGRVSAPDMKSLIYANVEGTENVLRVALKKNVTKVIILSSTAAAGPSFGNPVTEEDNLMPISNYGESKKRMELMVHRVIDEENRDADIKILRPTAVYGPREEQIFAYFKMASLGFAPVVLNKKSGTEPRISMVYIGDLVKAMVQSAEISMEGVNTYFISCIGGFTWDQIRKTLSSVFNKRIMPISINSSWVKRIGQLNEKASGLFGLYPMINKEKANELIMEWVFSIEKARKELGYEPTYTLQEGFSRTLEWYAKHHWI